MSYDPTPRPLGFTRPHLALGGLRLVDVTVSADVAAHDTVPAGTRLKITGRWAIDDHPMPWLRDAAAAAGHNGTTAATTEIAGNAPRLCVGDLVLADVAFRLSDVLLPDAVVLRGTAVEFTGTTVGTVTFAGWDDPPPPHPAPAAPSAPRRVLKRILRDDANQIIGIEETEQ